MLGVCRSDLRNSQEHRAEIVGNDEQDILIRSQLRSSGRYQDYLQLQESEIRLQVPVGK